MRPTILLSLVLPVVAALALGPTIPASGATPTPGGSIAVQLTTTDGAPLRLAGVEVAALGIDGIEADASTDATGMVVLGPVPEPQTVTVATRVIPDQGAATYAPARRQGVVVATETTTRTSLTLARGATVSGAIVGPSGVAAGGRLAALNEDDTSQVFQATSDAAGRYAFHGLGTGQYRIEASGTADGQPAAWWTRVVQQRGSAPASRVTLSTHYVHSTYDLAVSANSPDRSPDPELSGATVRIVDTTTGVSFSSRFGTLLDAEQTTQFVVPTGTYLVELVTVPTARGASRDLWLSRTDAGLVYQPDRALALPVAVHYPSWSGWGASVAPGGAN